MKQLWSGNARVHHGQGHVDHGIFGSGATSSAAAWSAACSPRRHSSWCSLSSSRRRHSCSRCAASCSRCSASCSRWRNKSSCCSLSSSRRWSLVGSLVLSSRPIRFFAGGSRRWGSSLLGFVREDGFLPPGALDVAPGQQDPPKNQPITSLPNLIKSCRISHARAGVPNSTQF